MAYSIVLGGNGSGASGEKSCAYVSGPFPSPDPSKGWATEWIVVDGVTEQVVGRTHGDGVYGDGLEGIAFVGGKTFTTADFEAWKVAIRRVKGSHVTIPYLAFFMRRQGLDPYLAESYLTPTADWSANDAYRTLVIEIGEKA